METFDENRIQNDGIIQQTQNTYTLSNIPETKAKWAEMIALFRMIGLRDVCRTSQGLYNPKGQVEVELEKIRSISGLACPVTRDVSLGAGNAHEQEGSPFPVDYLTVPFQGD